MTDCGAITTSGAVTPGELILPSTDASPDSTGEIRHDSTVAGLETGSLAWYDGDEVRYLVDLDVLPSDDDYVVSYDATNDVFYMKADADSGGATAWDDIGNPDADDTIAAAGYELTISSTIDEAGGTVWTIDHTDSDGLTNDTYLLELQHSNDGDEEAHFIRGVDNNSDVLWRIDYDGTAYFKSIVTDSTDDPAITFYDTGAAGADKADENAGGMGADFSTTTKDAEVSRLRITSFGGETAGTEYTAAYHAAADASWNFGIMTKAWPPVAVAGQEVLEIDTNTGTDNEILIGPGYSCGADRLSFSSFNLVTTGTILGAINIVTTTDGSESPTAEQMYGTMFIADNATAANDTDYTLPSAVAGMAGCFYDNGGGAGGIIIDAAAGDDILLYGAANGVAEAIDSPSGS
jgi:hypothetical protein